MILLGLFVFTVGVPLVFKVAGITFGIITILIGFSVPFIPSCVGARTQSGEQNEKITIIIDAQMRNEERFARNEERFARLAESQAHTDRRLDALIDIVRNGRNGKISN